MHEKQYNFTKVHSTAGAGIGLIKNIYKAWEGSQDALVEKNHEVVLFADDTSLIFKIKRRQIVYDDVNNSLSKVVHWFSVNNLL